MKRPAVASTAGAHAAQSPAGWMAAWTAAPVACEDRPMAPPRRTAYDRTLDWFSDHRMAMARAFVLLAVLSMFAGLLGAVIF